MGLKNNCFFGIAGLCQFSLVCFPSVAKKFDLPTMDVKVFDDSKTEVDEEAFGYLLTRPDLGVLEIVIPSTANIDGKMFILFCLFTAIFTDSHSLIWLLD